MMKRNESASDADADWEASSTMECDECGSDTYTNWGGDGDYVLCEACAKEAETNPNRSSYQTDAGVSKFVSFIGWVMVAIALIMIVASLASLGLVVALVPSFGLLTGGLLLVIAGQANRALLDNANSTRQILEFLKKEK